jgi:2-(1,2-epoxy-1,2-dihydrophenyl)acetyl-CoA isomerase
MRTVPKVIVGAINGPAFGAGLGIALACDLRIAAVSARFGTAFAKVGFSGDFGGSYHLTELIGAGRARAMYILGEPIEADEAQRLGLVTRVVPDEAVMDEALGLARRLAHGPLVAYGYMKRNLLAAETASLQEVLDLEAFHQSRTGMTEDHREAARAFVEKRPPVFRGR